MLAWQSFVLLFLLPAGDLALRLLGLPPPLVVVIDAGILFGLSLRLPRLIGLARPKLQRPELLRTLLACGLLLLAWYLLRVSAYNFGPYGENIYDLHYIASLARSSSWPALELWNPGTRVDHYYYFGFYVIAFYTRLLGLDIGTGYAAMLLLIPVVVFANVFVLLRGHFAWRALAALTATFPATGLSAIVSGRLLEIPGHLQGMAHVRLPEWTNLAPASGFLADVLRGYAYPVEGLAHILGSLGDLHPPVYTFVLLILVLCAMLGPAQADDDAGLPAYSRLMAGSAMLLSFVINPWTLPCFVAVGLYALSRPLGWKSAAWLLHGIAATLLLLAPLLLQLHLQTGSVGLRWLPAEQRSSFALLLSIWGPLTLLTAVLLLGAAVRIRWVLLLCFIAMVVGLEVLLVDDPYGDRYERFNGVLKIGSFALAGWTAVLLHQASRSPRRWIRLGILLPLLCLSLGLVWDSILPAVRKPLRERNWTLRPAAMLGDAEQQKLYSALRLRCPGLTLERQTDQAYSEVPLVSTLLGWPTLSPWTSHLSQIGAWSPAAQARFEQTQHWFADPQAALLVAAGVRYVLIDSGLGWSAATLQSHGAALIPTYQFVRIGNGEPVVGYFSSSEPCAGGS